MFWVASRTRIRSVLWVCRYSSSTSQAPLDQTHPNAPLDLDPTLRSLLNDVDMSLVKHKSHHPPREYRELEAIPADQSVDNTIAPYDQDLNTSDRRDTRKSPAALFGSRRVGAIELPFELQKSIHQLIAGKQNFLQRICLFHRSSCSLRWTPVTQRCKATFFPF
jgi:hypothetical protein